MVNLEHLAGRRVLSQRGESIGHIEEICAERDGDYLVVTEYHIGIYAAFERVSATAIAVAVLTLLRLRSGDDLYRIPWQQLDISDPMRPRLLCAKEELSHMKATRKTQNDSGPD